MQAIMRISLDNASFQDSPGEEAENVSKQIETFLEDHYAIGRQSPIRDINGNTIGQIEIKEVAP